MAARPLAAGEFLKYQALGNDYLVIAASARPPSPAWVRALCARHLGVGADGIVALGPQAAAGDLPVAIFNADGSAAEISGNGLRIAARAAHDLGQAGGDVLRLASAAGRHTARLLRGAGGRVTAIEVNLAPVRLGAAAVAVADPWPAELAWAAAGDDQVRLLVGTARVPVALVSVGNPHAVWLVPRLLPGRFARLGPGIARHPLFPGGINVQMAAVAGRDRLDVRIWERGVGPTQASGSSAAAAAAAAQARGMVGANVEVAMPGGSLQVHLGADGSATLTGPAEPVCRGTWLGEGGG